MKKLAFLLLIICCFVLSGCKSKDYKMITTEGLPAKFVILEKYADRYVAFSDGVVTKLYVKDKERVSNHQPIMEITSNDVIKLQEDLLAKASDIDFQMNLIKKQSSSMSLENKLNYDALASQKRLLIKAYKAEFEKYGISDSVVDEIIKTKIIKNSFELKSKQDGIMFDLNPKEQAVFKKGEILYTVAKLESIGLVTAVSEDTKKILNISNEVSAILPDGTRKKGSIIYIAQTPDEKTGKYLIGAEFNNDDYYLKPDTQAKMLVEK